MKVCLISITPDAEINIVEIARVSSSRTDKSEKPEGLINYLIKNSHWSPFEHSFLTVEIVTSKAIGIQLLRHRSFTFQELSQRYAVIENMEPVEIRKQAVTNRQSSTEVFNPSIDIDSYVGGYYPQIGVPASDLIQGFLKEAQLLYKKLLEAGVARECARMVLPMATQTTLYMTGSIRSWIHFLAIRDDGHAQLECRDVARVIKKIFVQELPIISKALGWLQD